MQRARAIPQPPPASPTEDEVADTTLLDLVRAISQETEDENEVVAAVLHLIRSGRVRLIGAFRGHRF